MKYFIIFSILLQSIFTYCQTDNKLVSVQGNDIIVYEFDAKNIKKSTTIFSLDSIIETNFFHSSIRQLADTLIIEVFDAKQKGPDWFKRRQFFFDTKTFKLLRCAEIIKKGKFINSEQTDSMGIETLQSYIKFEDAPIYYPASYLIEKSRIVDDTFYYSYSGNIYKSLKEGQNEIYGYTYSKHRKNLFLHHYKGGTSSNMKYHNGYRSPDLSSDKRKIICYDSYYKKGKKDKNTKYIVEIDTKTLTVTPKFEFISGWSPIKIYLMYSPDDKYIFFSYFLSVSNCFCFVYNQETSELIELPIGYYPFWLK